MKNEKYKYSDILNTFVNLIGYLKIITNCNSYNESKNQYEKILETITDWMIRFEKTRDLNFIEYNELNDIYMILDEFQTKYICNDSIGSESEFSDYALNWMQHLVTIVKSHNIDGGK